MRTVYLIVGVPASGKSWVCEQLTNQYEYVRHDDSIGGDYLTAIRERAETATKPLLTETPFSITQIMGPLTDDGFTVVPVFIIEPSVVLARRYRQREGKPIIAGHLTRQDTYRQRAVDGGFFVGTSDDVVAYMRTLVPAEAGRSL